MPVLPKIPLPKGDRWMHPKEVAKVFGVSVACVNLWAREGTLPVYKPSKNNVFKLSDVNKLLKARDLPTIT
jgi:predicted site-specific integrase-resolvase